MEDELANMLKKFNGWSDDAELKLYYGFDSIHGGGRPPCFRAEQVFE